MSKEIEEIKNVQQKHIDFSALHRNEMTQEIEGYEVTLADANMSKEEPLENMRRSVAMNDNKNTLELSSQQSSV